ncbi:MAG: sugar ABC transporter permease [Clostridia bacterium]|nr:sugar ABC transporter permease [Clostridia bacterium]
MSNITNTKKQNKTSNRLKDKLSKYAILYIMLIPFLAYYILFVYKPMTGLAIAFQNYSPYLGIKGSPWVGLKHFKAFLTNPYFGRTLKNTVVLNLYQLLFAFPAPIIFALLINEVRQLKLKKTIQTLTYMPYFISTVVVAGIVINLLSPSHGVITMIVEKFTGERIYFLTQPKYFRTIFTTMTIWKNIGYNSVVYLAALASVDMQLYEAAVVDGANKFKQIWHITIPGIMPTIIIMLILKIGAILSSATDTILLLYQEATYEVADTIGTYVYRLGIEQHNYSFAAAVGLFNSIIALIMVWISNTISKKVTEVGLW